VTKNPLALRTKVAITAACSSIYLAPMAAAITVAMYMADAFL
jgi:hypothetical protein